MPKSTAQKVYDYMVRYFVSNGHFPKQEEIAEEIEISRGRVGQILSLLASQGLIRLSKKYWKKANGQFGYDYREISLKNSDKIREALEKDHAAERPLAKD